MLRAAFMFFVLGLVALVFGASNFAGLSIEIGKILLFVFLALAVVSVFIGLITGRKTKVLP